MYKQKIIYFVLFCIVFFAFFLRIYRVTSVPPGLSWDEVSIGYNAYSILKTGKDEHQKFLPLDTFIGYGDYKPPLSIYATVPFVAVFGLNELSVRLPSILAGTFTVFLAFWIIQQLFYKDSRKIYLGLLTSFLIAISPWHIQLSRAGFEANIAIFLVSFSVYLALAARTKNKLLYICWIPLTLGIYTFNSTRYFAPLLGFALLIFGYYEYKKYSKNLVIGIILSIVMLLPIIPHLRSPQARLRYDEVNIFSDSSVVNKSNDRIAYEQNSFVSKLVNNRRIGYFRIFVDHYLYHFEPWFLFVKGDGNPKFSIQDIGQLYIIEAPFLLFGILWMLKLYPQSAVLLLFWLLMAIVPAAVARESPHALRIGNTLPVWQIFIAFGFIQIINTAKKWRIPIIVLSVFLLVFQFFNYAHNYYNHYPREYSGEWQYGYREAIQYAEKNKDSYNQIVLTDSIGRPYMYTLFYGKYSPTEFWQTKNDYFDASGFYHVNSFGKYQFQTGGLGTLNDKTLYIMEPGKIPDSIKTVYTINLLNGKPALVLFEKP